MCLKEKIIYDNSGPIKYIAIYRAHDHTSGYNEEYENSCIQPDDYNKRPDRFRNLLDLITTQLRDLGSRILLNFGISDEDPFYCEDE